MLATLLRVLELAEREVSGASAPSDLCFVVKARMSAWGEPVVTTNLESLQTLGDLMGSLDVAMHFLRDANGERERAISLWLAAQLAELSVTSPPPPPAFPPLHQCRQLGAQSPRQCRLHCGRPANRVSDLCCNDCGGSVIEYPHPLLYPQVGLSLSTH